MTQEAALSLEQEAKWRIEHLTRFTRGDSTFLDEPGRGVADRAEAPVLCSNPIVLGAGSRRLINMERRV